MEDSVAIQQLMNFYSVSSSRGNIEDVVSTYAPDGVWKIASMGRMFEGQAAIRDGLQKKLAPGDVVTIPVKTPHQLMIEPGKEFTYLTVKVTQ